MKNLDFCGAQTRNIKIIEPQYNIEYFYSVLGGFGEIANIDVCNYPNSLIFSFFDLNSSIQCAQVLNAQNNNCFSELQFIPSLNENSFFDYIVNISFFSINFILF